ncbi:MAG: 23S rRNA (uracil(747)-C(5))-methyltransferase RlmC [Actinobacteria bacterium]|nr:23S rRNA (uracil(747)-C(5))-methyltransferase RlmC [Actinomycetota bacterium]
MQCDYYARAECRSCAWIERPYADQLAAKQAHCESLLAGHRELAWEAPQASAEAGFRNKAKMVVAGTTDAATLGILDPAGRGVDLRDCGLHEPGLRESLPVLAELVARAGLTPYDVAARRGELKHLLVTRAPSGELMVRWVLRSQEPVARLRKHLPWLLDRLPVAVASVNLQPEHKAVLEGEREIVLSDGATLRMRVNHLDLHLRPQSFFQTNTAIAAALYRQATTWVDQAHPREVWDLYCGVGGFALHLAREGRRVRGVEISPEAIRSAEHTRDEAGLPGVGFEVGDATRVGAGRPDLVVVNPPRRGIGPELAAWIEASDARGVVYSSCNAESLARDLDALPSYVARRARLFDMFPQTAHHEVLVALTRA